MLTSSKLKDFAENNFKYDENDKKFSEREENTVVKREIAQKQAISPFPTVFFQKMCTADT